MGAGGVSVRGVREKTKREGRLHARSTARPLSRRGRVREAGVTAGRHGTAGQAIAQAAASVAVVGYDGSLPGPVVRRVLESSALVVGVARHLDGIGVPDHVRRILLGDDNRLAYARLTAHLGDPEAGPAGGGAGRDPRVFRRLRDLPGPRLRV